MSLRRLLPGIEAGRPRLPEFAAQFEVLLHSLSICSTQVVRCGFCGECTGSGRSEFECNSFRRQDLRSYTSRDQWIDSRVPNPGAQLRIQGLDQRQLSGRGDLESFGTACCTSGNNKVTRIGIPEIRAKPIDSNDRRQTVVACRNKRRAVPSCNHN